MVSSPFCKNISVFLQPKSVHRESVRRARAIAGRDEPRERSASVQDDRRFCVGKTVWFWHPLLVLNSRRLVGPTGQTKPQSAGDGDNKNSSPGRARHKP